MMQKRMQIQSEFNISKKKETDTDNYTSPAEHTTTSTVTTVVGSSCVEAYCLSRWRSRGLLSDEGQLLQRVGRGVNNFLHDSSFPANFPVAVRLGAVYSGRRRLSLDNL